MKKEETEVILQLMKREVVPAIGCTEPVAVALAVSKAREVLGEKVVRAELYLSSNILKNSMGVGIPGTGMIGLPIAIALGIVIGRSEYGLEVLKDLDDDKLEEAKQVVEEKQIVVHLKEDASDKLYIEACCFGNKAHSKAIICGTHTNIAYVESNDVVILDKLSGNKITKEDTDQVDLNFNKIYEFATETPLEELEFLQQAAVLNKLAADESANGTFGHSVARVIQSSSYQNIMGDSVYNKLVAVTAAACDVRMAGAMIPVMSNSGSGNQGITATLPVVVFAEEMKKTKEQMIRALALSHLMVIYIKRGLGRLSGLCGVTVAGIGASCGITYLMGGNRDQVAYSVKNMIGNIAGVICDGAKPSCALKVSNAASSATFSAMMAMDNKVVSSLEGIADNDVDKTIRNLTDIGSEGMSQTDKMVLDIMTKK
ncbi:L-serine ammonia-lyase, iron-sulfur-dependent, subunit alpha [uncultured Draconibacterium sp.]|uniref:L-cysteine desulfidase family protein n=1 Tax=uncultured Draconibacterium sp. TaxID=1573823 RepID=UPI0029C66EA8|nr:L-serine ammonia-lyase, iron-sulfur-dependent, subunit alpha [uncultured Draconibacterium sp.]